MRWAVLTRLIQKEWLKLRLWGWVPLVLTAVVLLDTYLTLHTIAAMHGKAATWLGIVQKEQVFFGHLLWVFVGAGVFWALLSMVPECIEGRLRLSLHLPADARGVLGMPVAVGVVSVLSLGLLAGAGLALVNALLGMPWLMSWPMVVTLLPWCLAGVVAWCATAACVAEPSRKRKCALLLAGAVYISMLGAYRGFDAMQTSWPLYVLVTVPWVFVPFTGAMRIKEG